MKAQLLPMLREDGSTLDWTDATYEVNVLLRGVEGVTVEHILKKAGPFHRLIDAELCQWVTEIRCPRTLYSYLELSKQPSQEIAWKKDQIIWENTFLVCGLVATHPIRLRDEGLNHSIWPKGTILNIPPGWWLALSDMRELNPLGISLLRPKLHKWLPDGQMHVEEDKNRETPRFLVHLAPDIHPEFKNRRDLHIAALIGAFSHMPKSSMKQEGEMADHPVTEELRRRLEEADVYDWDDADNYDPVAAATVIEKIHLLGANRLSTELNDEDDA